MVSPLFSLEIISTDLHDVNYVRVVILEPSGLRFAIPKAVDVRSEYVALTWTCCKRQTNLLLAVMLASGKSSLLPIPVSFSGSHRPYRVRGNSRSRPNLTKLDVLLTRARVTNLGLLLLAGFATLSFLINIRYLLVSHEPQPFSSYDHTPYSILETLSRDKSLLGLTHLVLVPGHAIWTGTGPEDVHNEDKWILESYQKGGGRIEAFVKHIETG